MKTPTPDGQALVQVRGLQKTFGATRALVNVSTDFRAGEIHCVLGENGAGKSTLGKILGGLYQADAGELLIKGEKVSFASPRAAHAAGVAMVYQELSLAPDLSVRANLWLGSEEASSPFSGISRRKEHERAASVVRKLGVEVDLEQPVGQLPVAIQQLIEIGKSLMFSPRIIVFDEPTAMLGAVEKQKFFDVLRQLRDEGVAAVLVTHHIEDVMAVSDRVTIMRNGQVVDSFPMAPDVDADRVVERLTGRKQQVEVSAPAAPRGAVVLDIEGIPLRGRGPGSLTLCKGQIVGFYGVVGCGAERILLGLAGVQLPGPLAFRLHGRAYQPSSPTQASALGVSYLPAGRAAHGILPTRSILENLTLTSIRNFSRAGFVDTNREAQEGERLLSASQVKYADPHLPITSLSGGNQQKVLLARVMSSARDVLLLEEPTAGVDIEAKHQIHQRIRSAAQQGLTVVVISSDLVETIALCDTVHTIYAGTVIATYENPGPDAQPAIIADVLGQACGTAIQ
ncbi:sugar ABC transporter ATP-binding protein [Hydrogenophaga sp.]|uniref:sugar ABC transporter ATP-binding protein n=1 Tax=Hydrogenophaga sp. TaxID=1904254 RepID=UPI003F6F66B5